MKNFKEIQKYRKTIYSQNGEDGVLDFILSKLNTNGWLVEFGAWDGKYLSNTFYFIEKKNYKAVLIEGDSSKMPDLYNNTKQFGENVHCLNAFVNPSGENSLDNLLRKTNIPKDFDVLSIDVDGMDYYIWKEFVDYRPKVVIVEINIKDKPGTDHIHDQQQKEYVWGQSGSSIDSMTKLAHEKGYALIANVACNAIYVDNKYLSLFFDREPSTFETYTYESFDITELSLSECKQKGTSFYLKKLIKSVLPFSHK